MQLTHNQTVRGLQVINHILMIAGVIFVLFTGTWEWLGTSLIFYVVTGILGVNVGYHRLISHRSFKTYLPIEKLLSVIGVVTTIGSPMAWTAIHRQHHRAAEKPDDPHSPYQVGKFNAWFGFWNYLPLNPKLVREMRKDKFQKFLHNHYLALIVVYCGILAMIDPLLVIFGYAIPACLCLHSTSSIIVIAHYHGYKPYQVNDESRNSWIAHLLSLGEGWHNTHHAKPYQWQQGEQWWEFDPPSWIIRLIKK